MKRHTRSAAALASLLLMTAAAAGCSDGGSGSGSASGTGTGARDSVPQAEVPVAASKSATATVSVKDGTYGKALVDENGMTIYVFDKDTKNKSNCVGACADQWPPLLDKTAPTAGSGAKADLLGTTTRSDGKKQVTYNGHPLYRFDEDQKAGDTKGQAIDAFGAKWYVISPEGKKITTKPTNGTGDGY